MAHYYVDKRLGETPLEALHRLRKEEGLSEDVPLTYAGRLDPAAEGVLLVLSGEDCKHKDDFLSLPKTYEVEVLLGIETDTHDLLGIPKVAMKDIPIEEYLQTHIGVFEQPYPAFSSKPVDSAKWPKRLASPSIKFSSSLVAPGILALNSANKAGSLLMAS